MAGRRWTMPNGPSKQVSVQERECSPFLSTLRGLLFSTQHPTKLKINATYYTTSVLPRVVLYIQSTARNRRRSWIQLHHDNAVPHKGHITQTSTYLDDNGIRLMKYPPYSPNLAPCDFWLFAKIKSSIAEKPFSRIQDLVKAVYSEVRATPASRNRECFQKWRMRMQTMYRSPGKLLWGNYRTAILEIAGEPCGDIRWVTEPLDPPS